MRAQPNNRAFESSLSEWKNVDTSADAWCIRHYDHDAILFDGGAMILNGMIHLFDSPSVGKGNKRFNTEKFAEMQKSLAGVTFSIKGKNICMKILSPDKDFLEKQATAWKKCAEPVNGNLAAKENAVSPAKVSLNGTVLKIESPLDASMWRLGFHMRMILGDVIVI